MITTEVTLSYPAELSPESYQDMADRIEILLRGLKRRADAEAARRRTERAGGDGKGPAPDMSPSFQDRYEAALKAEKEYMATMYIRAEH